MSANEPRPPEEPRSDAEREPQRHSQLGNNIPPQGPPGLERHEVFSARMVAGAIIIALGAMLLAENLGWFDARYILHSLWPLALVAFGVAMVRNPQHRRSRAWGWVLITVGFWIFADNIGWVHISLGQILLPGLLLFVGGMLVFRSLSGPPAAKSAAEPVAPDHAEFVRSFTMLSGAELRPVSRPFRGADISVVMGGVKLDLTGARMEGDNVTVEVFAFWGGVEIFLPPDWTVDNRVTTLLAGLIDKRRPTSVVPTKTLVLQGMGVMSGIEVKN